jgi:hypothetical protein
MRGMMGMMNFHILKYKRFEDKIDISPNQMSTKYY